MSYNEEEVRSARSKAMDMGKAIARRAIKKFAQELAKKLIKVLAKLVLKLLTDAIVALVGAIGIPAAIITLCAILLTGIGIFVFKTGDWADEASGMTKEQVVARYNVASQSTADEDHLRVPIHILQSLDALQILKEGKEPNQMDPEAIAQGLTAEKKFEDRENTTTSWSETDGSKSSESISTTKVKLLIEVQSWNRKFEYTYEQLTDSTVHSYYSSTSCSPDGTGSSSSDSSTSTSNWVQDAVTNSGELTTYTYKTVSNYTFHGGSSNEIVEGCTEDSSTSTYDYTNTEKWVLSTILEKQDYEKFNNTLIRYNYTKGDFSILKDAIKDDDPELSSISGYVPSGLTPDVTDFMEDDYEGGGEGGGGSVPDAPVIPSSGEWGFPTLTKALLGSPYGWRYDDTKGKEALHKGQDIKRTPDDRDNKVDYAIYTVADGGVEWAGFRSDGYGYSVIINHGDGVKTRYAHMASNSLQVKKDDPVKKGKSLGIMGSTGLSDGIHLHFEVIVDGKPVNPVGYIRK